MKPKTQWQVVVESLEELGGIATLGRLTHHVLSRTDFQYTTQTPGANVRRIVQTRPDEIYKIRPGLYALTSHRSRLEAQGVEAEEQPDATPTVTEHSHGYYQGLLTELGNLRTYQTFVPQQDKNRTYLSTPLKDLRSLDTIPEFSYPNLVKRARTIDVIWFNQRQMPASFFEVEHTTDIQNSLLKFQDLQDFAARMIIVAHKARETQFKSILEYTGLQSMQGRVEFVSYEEVVFQHTRAWAAQTQRYKL